MLERCTPESQGMASSALLDFVAAVEDEIDEMHSFMLLRHGKVVAEGWWQPYARDLPHMLFSLSKSFTSTAVGMAVAEGRLSVDDPVLSFFPDETPDEVNDHLAALRVRHLLSMSTGQDTDTMGPMVEAGDWVKGFFTVPFVHAPGTHFLYNTGATYILSAIVQKLTGEKLVDYLQPRLFGPLGIENPTWEESPQRINTGGFGLSIRTEDIARFGQLYLQRGRWGDQQIIPEAWVEEATRFHVSNGDDPNNDWNQGYGYQFWRCRHNVYRGDGAFGQFCVVMADQDAVMAITSGTSDLQKPLNLIWDRLLPAMQDGPLAEDRAAQERLQEKLASLVLAPAGGDSTSPTATTVSGRVYAAEDNPANVKSVALTFAVDGCVLEVTTPYGSETIPCGYGVWRAGETLLFNAPWDAVAQRVVASGVWTDAATFTVVVRRTETPFYHTLAFRFDGDAVTVDLTVNVTFDPDHEVRLVARAE